jgi:hypothetical protein
LSKLREQLKDASEKRAALARGKASRSETGNLDKLADAAESRGDVEARAIEEAHTRGKRNASCTPAPNAW